jgi:hypothetical protein
MYLRDLAVYADKIIFTRFPSGFVAAFHRETCCITDLYCSVLGKRVATPDTVKANVLFTEHNGSVPSVSQFIHVADAKWPFRFSQFADGDDFEKKQMILEAVHSALLWIASERRWDVGGLEECHAEIIRRNLSFNGLSKKSWLSPNRRYRARLGFIYELRKVDFVVGVFDRRGREIGRKSLGSIVPEMGILHGVMKGNGTWVTDSVFRLQTGSPYLRVPKFWEVDLSDLLT